MFKELNPAGLLGHERECAAPKIILGEEKVERGLGTQSSQIGFKFIRLILGDGLLEQLGALLGLLDVGHLLASGLEKLLHVVATLLCFLRIHKTNIHKHVDNSFN